jgi:hypothetical protein
LDSSRWLDSDPREQPTDCVGGLLKVREEIRMISCPRSGDSAACRGGPGIFLSDQQSTVQLSFNPDRLLNRGSQKHACHVDKSSIHDDDSNIRSGGPANNRDPNYGWDAGK